MKMSVAEFQQLMTSKDESLKSADRLIAKLEEQNRELTVTIVMLQSELRELSNETNN